MVKQKGPDALADTVRVDEHVLEPDASGQHYPGHNQSFLQDNQRIITAGIRPVVADVDIMSFDIICGYG
jgi:hypothetical protein